MHQEAKRDQEGPGSTNPGALTHGSLGTFNIETLNKKEHSTDRLETCRSYTREGSVLGAGTQSHGHTQLLGLANV